jgi:hypothetical protein
MKNVLLEISADFDEKLQSVLNSESGCFCGLLVKAVDFKVLAPLPLTVSNFCKGLKIQLAYGMLVVLLLKCLRSFSTNKTGKVVT